MNASTSLLRGHAPAGAAPSTPAGLAEPTTPRRRRARPASASGEVARQATMLTIALAVTVPLASLTVLWTSHGTDDLNRAVFFAPFDLVLAATFLWSLRRRHEIADLFRAPAVRLVSLAYVVVFGVSMAMHPSPLGVAQGLHLAGGLAVMVAVSIACSKPDTRRHVLAAVTAVGVFEAALAIVQSRHGGPLGIAYLDFEGPLYQFGSSYAGRGGFTHPYHLDLLLVIAQGAAILAIRSSTADGLRARAGWIAALVVLGAGMGVTYSRTALIGQAVVGIAVIASKDRKVLLPLAAAVLAGIVLTGATFGSGWSNRTSTSTDSAAFDSGRRQRMEESLTLFRSSPIVGVGPGRYVDALAATKFKHSHLPSHDLVLQEGAELGALGYVLAAAFLGLLALRAWRGGAWTIAVVAPVVPFLLLDSYAYAGDTGLALSALWLGLVRASLHPADPDRSTADDDADAGDAADDAAPSSTTGPAPAPA